MKKRYRNVILTTVLLISFVALATPVVADLPLPAQERRRLEAQRAEEVRKLRDEQEKQRQSEKQKQEQLRREVEQLRQLEIELCQAIGASKQWYAQQQVWNQVSRITMTQVEEANKWLEQFQSTRHPQATPLSKELLQSIDQAETANKQLLEQLKQFRKERQFEELPLAEGNSSETLFAGKTITLGIADFAVFGFVALAFVCWRRIANSSKNTSPSNDHVYSNCK